MDASNIYMIKMILHARRLQLGGISTEYNRYISSLVQSGRVRSI